METVGRFLAVLDWDGDEPPSAETIAGGQVVAQGWAHILTIRKDGRLVLGHRDLAFDGIVGLREGTHRSGGTVLLHEGATPLRPATSEEAASMPVLSTWGLRVISAPANRCS